MEIQRQKADDIWPGLSAGGCFCFFSGLSGKYPGKQNKKVRSTGSMRRTF
jgi:hypothetical protein